MAGADTLILASDYNTIQSKAALILGTGSGDYGYGQTVSSAQVAANAKISVAQWYALRTDIVRCRQHQTTADVTNTLKDPALNLTITATTVTNNRLSTTDTGQLKAGDAVSFSGTVFGNVALNTTYYVSQVVSTTQFTISETNGGVVYPLATASGSMTMRFGGVLITETDRAAYAAMIADAETNRLAVPPATQATRENLVNTVTRTTAWNGVLTQTITVTFDDTSAIRYYFNSGSRIEFSSSRTGGTAGDKNTSWTTLLTNMGTIYFNRTDTTCTGTGTTSSIGWADLTTSDQTIFIKDVSGTTYAPNRYQIKAKLGATANVIIFTIEWRDDSVDSPPTNPPYYIDENVNGTLTSLVQVYRASGSYVSVPKPPATTTTF